MTTRCLFVGLGSIGQRHLRNLPEVLGGDIEVLAFRARGERLVLDDDQNEVPGEDLIQKYGIRVFHDLDEALAARPQVTFVTSPSRFHVEPALRAAGAGSHLFIEKPVSDRLDGIDALIRLVEERGLVASVGYQWRYHPAYREIRRRLETGQLGRVWSVRAEVGEFLPDFHPYEDYRRSYAARRDLGGGVLLTQIHEFDYLYGLFGLPRRIFTLGGRLSSLEIDVEDVATSLLDYRAKDGGVFPAHVHQDYLRPIPRRCFEIQADEGSIRWSLSDGFLEISDAGGRLVERQDFSEHGRNRLFVDELTHFFRCVEDGGTPEVGLRDATASLRMALAAKHSLETGLPVDLGDETAV